MSLPSLCPRGNALTESMPFADREGIAWLAYIEGIASAEGHLPGNGRLPGRRLRFDSETDSRVTSELPAGAPFLSDERLQALLDRAQAVTAPTTATWVMPALLKNHLRSALLPHRVNAWHSILTGIVRSSAGRNYWRRTRWDVLTQPRRALAYPVRR